MKIFRYIITVVLVFSFIFSNSFAEIDEHENYLAPQTTMTQEVSTSSWYQNISFPKIIVWCKRWVIFGGILGALSFMFYPRYPLDNQMVNQKILLIDGNSIHPPWVDYSPNVFYLWNQNRILDDPSFKESLNPVSHQLNEMIPDWSLKPIWSSDLRLTYHGAKVLGAYHYLVLQNLAPVMSDDFYQYLDGYDAMKIRSWMERFHLLDTQLNHASLADITNRDIAENLEQIREESWLYMVVKRHEEATMYQDYMISIDDFDEKIRQDLGVSLESFLEIFDQFYEALWLDKFSQSDYIEQTDHDLFRDYILLNAIYQYIHRSYDDLWIVEGVSNSDSWVTRSIRQLFGKESVSDASLGLFQGYDRGFAASISQSPRLQLALIQSKNLELRQLARRWLSKTKDEIYADIHGIGSPLNSIWQTSLIGLMDDTFMYFESSRQRFRLFRTKDNSLLLSYALSVRKSKGGKHIHNYLLYDDSFAKSLLQPGQIVQIPFNESHLYIPLIGWPIYRTDIQLISYYQVPKLNSKFNQDSEKVMNQNRIHYAA